MACLRGYAKEEVDIVNEFFADNLSDIPSEDDSDDECSYGRRRRGRLIGPLKVTSILSEELETEHFSEEDLVIAFDSNHPRYSSSGNWNTVDVPPKLEAFEGHPGLTVPLTAASSVGEITSIYFGEDLFEMMSERTNLYHLQNSESNKSSEKHLIWVDVTPKEMKKFLGILVLMSVLQKEYLKDYWTTDPILATPAFRKLIRQDRFEQILKFWHFNDNEKMDEGSDRMYKIKPLWDYLLPKFRNVYKPKQHLSIDEIMVPWRALPLYGHLYSSEMENYGFLIRKVCESDTGYVCNMEIYTGEGKNVNDTIMSVIDPMLGMWHHIYLNSYHNSVANAEILLENKTRLCGRIRGSKGLPEGLNEEERKLKKGESAFQRRGDVLVQVWKKKRVVRMVSTIHSSKMELSMGINKESGIDILEPMCVLDYKKRMKAIEKSDQYLEEYPVMRKAIKWTKKLGMYLINCGLFNSYVIYNTLNRKKLKYYQFRSAVAEDWVTDGGKESLDNACEEWPTRISDRAPDWDPPQRLSGDMSQHIIDKIPSVGDERRPIRACRVCYVSGRESETRYICKFCEIPLHKGICFQRYHLLEDY